MATNAVYYGPMVPAASSVMMGEMPGPGPPIGWTIATAVLAAIVLGLVAWIIYLYLHKSPSPTIDQLNGVWIDNLSNRLVLGNGYGTYANPVETTIAPPFPATSLFKYVRGTAPNTYTMTFAGGQTQTPTLSTTNTGARILTFPAPANGFAPIWIYNPSPIIPSQGLGVDAVGITAVTGTWMDTTTGATINLVGPGTGILGLGTYTLRAPNHAVGAQPVSYTYNGNNGYLFNLLQLDQVPATLSPDRNTLTLSSPVLDFSARWVRQ